MAGLDIKTIVSQLMEVEKRQTGRLNKIKAGHDLQLSSYGKLNDMLGKFTSTVNSLAAIFMNNSYTVASSNEQVVSAALTGVPITPGTHQIAVTQLAQANQIASTSFTSKTDALSLSNTLNVTVGANSFSLTINPGDSLETIRDNINNSLNNTSVNASILSTTSASGSPEYRLILSSDASGVANQLMLSGDAVGALEMTNVLTVAQDAQFTFDGFSVDSATNTVTDLLDGLIVNLNGVIGTATLSVSVNNTNQNESIINGIQGVVTAYNEIIGTIDKNESLRSLHDGTYSLIKLQLQNVIQQQLGTPPVASLLDLGLYSQAPKKLTNDEGTNYVTTGELAINMEQLTAALNNFPQNVNQFFTTAGTGFIAAIDAVTQNISEQNGTINNREQIIKQENMIIDSRIYLEESRLARVRESLIRRYSALDSYIQRYQQISDFLDRQLASMDFSHLNKR